MHGAGKDRTILERAKRKLLDSILIKTSLFNAAFGSWIFIYLKLAILKQVSTDYENRENYSIYDQAYELSSDAKRQAQPYCRNTLFGI